MHSNNPRRLDNLAADQVVIGLFLQDENFRGSVVSYILGDSSIETLNQALDTALRDIYRVDSLDSYVPAYNALTRIFTQEGSFFRVLRQIVTILNRNGVQRINRDDVNRYLEVYETTMEEVEQFRYINLSNSIYQSILSRLDENQSIEERFIFNVLAGNNPNKMQTQLLQGELREIFEIDRIAISGNSELRASWALDALISTATPESQDQLFMQTSNLLTFIENQNLANTEEDNNLLGKQLRYTILRSAIDRRFSNFVDMFVRHDLLPLSVENVYFAFEQATVEGREDVQRTILEAGNYEVFRKSVQDDNNDLLCYLWERAESFRDMQLAMLKANSYEAFRVTAHNNGYTYMLLHLWEKAELLDVQCEMLKVNRYEVFKVAAHDRETDLLDFLWEKAGSLGVQREMLAADDYEVFRVVFNDSYAVETLNSLWTKAKSLGKDVQHEMLKSDNYYAFRIAARSGCNDIVYSLWEKAKLLDVQREMLRAGNYEAFIMAAANGHDRVLEFLWNAAKSLEGTGKDMQCEMLRANNHVALAYMFKSFTNIVSLQESAEIIDQSEPQPGPSSEYEPPPKRPRIGSGEEEQHNTGETSSAAGTNLDDITIHQSKTRSPGSS